MRLPLPSNPHGSTLHLGWTRAHDPAREPQVRDLLDAAGARLDDGLRSPGRLLSDLSRCFTSAALYPQLLTLARPTDRNVRRWNRWSAAHHKAVAAELLGTGSVLEGKRARAGRTLFVPGGWTELEAPHLPLETAKPATHLVEVQHDKDIAGPFTAVLPRCPCTRCSSGPGGSPVVGDSLPPLPRPVRGVHVRNVQQTACPGHVALVWLDAEPGHSGTDVEVVDDLPDTCRSSDEPLPEEFRSAFAQGVREGLARLGGGRSPYAVRIVLRDARWHEIDSSARSFEGAGGYAAAEILACVREGRDPRPAGRGARPDRPAPAMPRDRRRAHPPRSAGPDIEPTA